MALALLAAHLPVIAVHGQEVEPAPTPELMHSSLVDAASGLELAIAALQDDQQSLQAAGELLLAGDGPIVAIRAVESRLQDLYPQESALLAELARSLETALAAGNRTDALALTRALRGALSDLLPRLEEYEQRATYVSAIPQTVQPGAELTVPVVVGLAPSDGFAAYEVTVRFEPTVLRADSVSGLLGEGATKLDNEQGVVRLSGFDVRGFVELGPSAASSQPLAEITFTATGSDGDSTSLAIEQPALFTAEGTRVLAQGVDASISIQAKVSEAENAATPVYRYLAVAGVLLVAGIGLWAIRRAVT